MEIMSPVKYANFAIPQGRDISEWEFYQDIVNANVLINVPIAKHHSLARLTLGAKNLIGVVTKPNQIHRNLHQRVADIASLIRPNLTVIDGVRVLIAEGTYTSLLRFTDLRVFIDRDYRQTLEARMRRARDKFEPFVLDVLEREHQIIARHKDRADVVVTPDFGRIETQTRE